MMSKIVVIKILFLIICSGVEDFESAMENWFEALDIMMADTKPDKQEISQEEELLKSELEKTLHALICSSKKVRRLLEEKGLSHLEKRIPCNNVLTWIDDKNFEAERCTVLDEAVEDLESSVESDTESFVSASESAQLEVQYFKLTFS